MTGAAQFLFSSSNISKFCTPFPGIQRREHIANLHYFPNKFCCLIPPVQTFGARTHHTVSKEPKNHHFIRVPKVRSKYHTDSFIPKKYKFVEHTFPYVLRSTMVLNSSKQGWIAICPFYHHFHHFLLFPISFMKNTIFIITILKEIIWLECYFSLILCQI